ncbi:hypothetical protein PV05_08334 [Exophiala xenobiotica]|uniref:Uncharacterized protein n=1 Tax=Exophiala xenobiotica TaxID=348802 RepID=A0A0D2EDE7_9EURO|nr:uncharacterized protein PV05_08334 [Exophiala xenobiotica]KIW52710.1 hypothetical protein PV05_08334 [Exophiala xenobiotica]
MLDHHDREYVEFWDGVLQLRRTILPGYQTRQQAQSLLDLVETYYSTNERDDLKGLLQALVDYVGLHTYVSLDLLNKDEVLGTMQQIVDGVNIRDLEVLRASPAPEKIDEREESPDAQPHPPTTDPDKKQWVFVCDHCTAYIRQKNDFHKHQQYGTQRSGYNNKRTLDAGTRGRTTRRSQDLESTVATRSNYQTDYDIEKNNYFIVICTKKREDTNPSGPSTTVICTGAIAFRCGPYTMYDDCARTRQKHQLLRVSAGQQVVAQGGSLDGWSTMDPPWDYTWGSWACRRLSFPERSL